MDQTTDTTTISLNSKKILEKTFVPHGNGYDPEEVDSFLDQIIHDYIAFESYYRESKEYTISLEKALRKERETVQKLEVENATYRKRLGNVRDSDNVSNENIDLLNRIRRLETELYRHGIDPNSIK